ncbi:hypothetical protein AB4536_21885 [Vibrio cyclitrophicus]
MNLINRLNMFILKNRNFEYFSIYYCIFTLLLIGSCIGYFFGTNLSLTISFFANVSTIVGFIFAYHAYVYWTLKDTISAQKQTLRDLLLELAELNNVICKLFGRVCLNELRLINNPSLESNFARLSIPNQDERIHLKKMSQHADTMSQLIRKYYVLEPYPAISNINMDTAFPIEGEIFYDLKSLILMTNKLYGFTSDGFELEFIEGQLISNQPNLAALNVNLACHFNGENNFESIFKEFINRIKCIQTQLLRQVT